MSKKPTHRSMFDEKHTRKVRDNFVFAVLVCVAVVLIFLNFQTTTPISKQLAESERRLRDLVSTKARLQSMESELREKPAQHIEAIGDYLQHCRSAGDVPDFHGGQVIAYRGDSTLACYVPPGNHQLEILAVRELKPANAPKNQRTANEPEDEKTWSVPLRGNTGYILNVITDPEAQLLGWELSGNSPEFNSRKETIFMGGFEKGRFGPIQSLVVGGRTIVVFPNQVQRRPTAFSRADQITHWQESRKRRPMLHLFSSQWRSKTGSGPRAEIRISAKLFSEGPAQVAATDAAQIITLQRSDLLMPYEGGGKYELRASK